MAGSCARRLWRRCGMRCCCRGSPRRISRSRSCSAGGSGCSPVCMTSCWDSLHPVAVRDRVPTGDTGRVGAGGLHVRHGGLQHLRHHPEWSTSSTARRSGHNRSPWSRHRSFFSPQPRAACWPLRSSLAGPVWLRRSWPTQCVVADDGRLRITASLFSQPRSAGLDISACHENLLQTLLCQP